jgi:multiple antibiotic resistance protein
MLDYLIETLALFFATMNPLNKAAVFVGLTSGMSRGEQRRTACKAVAVAGGLLLIFAIVGDDILVFFGTSIPSLKIAGGLLLLLLAIRMVLGGGVRDAKTQKELTAQDSGDVAIFPLAMPLIAGPASLSAAVLLFGDVRGQYPVQVVMGCGMFAVLLLTLCILLLSRQLLRLLGHKGMEFVTRIMGLLLTALSVEYIVDGIHTSKLFMHAAP